MTSRASRTKPDSRAHAVRSWTTLGRLLLIGEDLVRPVRRSVGSAIGFGSSGRQAEADPRLHPFAPGQAPRRTLGDDRAVRDDRDTVREVLRLVHVVGREEHRLAHRREVPDDLPGVAAGPGVEARGGLVQEQELGVAGHGDRDVQASLLPAGELVHADVALLDQPDDLDDLVGRSTSRVVAGVHLDRLAHREERIDPRGLQDDADPAPQLGRTLRRVVPQDRHVPRRAVPIALEDLDGGRLAGAVRPEEGEDLAGVDGQVDPGDGLDVAVRLAEVRDDDRWIAHVGQATRS